MTAFCRPLYRIAIAAVALWCATGATARATEFADAYQQASAGAWRNPVMAVDQDPRKEPDVKALLAAGDMAVYTSEYFPGWTISSRKSDLVLFHRLPQVWRIGGPTRVAFSSGGKAEVFNAGQAIPAEKLAAMDKAWLLVWFAGSRNWDKFDMPVLVVLQHKPTAATLDQDLRVTFAKDAGQVTVLNLFGYYRPPQDNPTSLKWVNTWIGGQLANGAFGVELGPVAPINVRPYEWTATLPDGIVQRCDYFASLSRAIPTFMRDTFQVDLAANALRIKYKVSYLESTDDWNTAAKKLAPVAPTFALAAQYGMPITTSAKTFDPIYPTTLGPWTGVPDVDEYQIDLNILQYLSETYLMELATESKDPLVQASIKRLTQEIANFPSTAQPFGPNGGWKAKDQKVQNFVWGTITSFRTQAYALHFLTGDLRTKSVEGMRNFLEYTCFTDSGYRAQKVGDKTFFQRQDAGIGGDVFGDAGKLVVDEFLTGWLAAYHGKDYGWLATGNKTEVMEKLAGTLAQMGWARGGRANIAEMGDEAGPMMGFARLMYAGRDQSRFAWGTYVATMELTKLFVKCGPLGDYARHFQPWTRFEMMDDTENATDINGSAYGWQIGGGGHDPIAKNMAGGINVAPYERHGSGQWVQRWRSMADLDVNRFFRERCVETPGGLRFEFNNWLARDFADIGPDAKYPTKQGEFENPAKVLSMCKQMLGETTEQVRARMKGWDMTWKHLDSAGWNWEPAPWIYWALKDQKQYERIMKPETLPWTPGLGSVYQAEVNDLTYATNKLAGKDDVTGDLLLPFPQISRWKGPAAPKGSDWGLGFITADPAHKLASAKKTADVTQFAWSATPVEPDPYEVPLEGNGWVFQIDPTAKGIAEGWFNSNFDDTAWKHINVPGQWEDQGWSGKDMPRGAKIPREIMTVNAQPRDNYPYDGLAWYRIKVKVPQEFAGREVYFHAGTIDDFDIVWINGVKVGHTDAGNSKSWWSDTRLYKVPAEVIKPGQENTVTVLVGDNNAGGGITQGPVRLIAR